MTYCLPKFEAGKFLRGLKDGTIDPAKLSKMTSEQRRKFFEEQIGKDHARDVNALFESKLLLKNQQQGMITWAKAVSGIKAPVQRDIISRIQKMDKILSPAEEQKFLEDLASKRLGTDVTVEEAKVIAELSKRLTESKEKVGESEEARLEFGANKVALQNYVNNLKISNNAMTPRELVDEFKARPLGAANDAVSYIAGTAKGIKASLDNSAIFRQGWKVLYTHPKIWGNRAAQTFVDIKRQLGKKATDDTVMDGIKAEISSRPNALNGTYDRMKLDIGTGEEAFPTALPTKIPLFGRLYSASQTAYTGFLYKVRADIADKYVRIAEQSGVDITERRQAEAIGKMINSLTGRGHLGSLEKIGKTVNNIFFSPKLLKSHLDFLTAHAFDDTTAFVKKRAAMNLLKVITGTAVILGSAKALDPESVDFDPRSSDFGQIRVGDTRFNVTAGMNSIITLAARLVTQSSKSSSSGKITELGGDAYGAQSGEDVFFDFFGNKLSPAAAVIRNLIRQETFDGEKPTLLNQSMDLLVPIPILNFNELNSNPNAANILLAMIADGLGIATNTFSASADTAEKRKMRPKYEEVQALVNAGKQDEADAMVSDFTDAEYEAYKAIKKEHTDASLAETKERIKPIFDDAQMFLDEGRAEEAQAIVDSLSDEEYKAYESLKKSAEKDVISSTLKDGTPVIVKEKPISEQGVIGTVVTYAKAVGVDPITAFKRIFTGQRIRRVDNGTIIVNRMTLEDSQAVKKERNGDTVEMKLDHTIPLQLGGGNDESNLKLVPTADWQTYTAVENYLGEALRTDRIEKKEAQDLIISFKDGEISFEDIKAQLE